MKRSWIWGVLGAIALVTIMSAEAEAHHRKIVVEGFRADESNMSLQLGFSALSIGDDGMDVENVAQLGGINMAWRWDLVDWGGLEIAFGGYGRSSDDGIVNESRSTFTLAWMWYFARHYHHRFYGVTGFTGLNTSGDIDGYHFYDYSEGGLTLGLGSEWLVGKNWLVSMDVRTMLLSSDGEDEYTYNHVDGVPYDWINPPQERLAATFNFGVGYRW